MTFVELAVKWIMSPLFWLLILIVAVGAVFGMLWVRKWKRLAYPVIEIVDLGNGKFALNLLSAGKFGKNSYVRAIWWLWWYGPEVMRTSTGEEIRDLSTEDYQEVNSVRGIVCFRDVMNGNVLVPISKLGIKGKEMLAEIAPSSYVDSATDCFKDAVKETTSMGEKLLAVALYAVLFIVGLVMIILIIQFANSRLDKAQEAVTLSGANCQEACKSIISNVMNVVKGSSP